MKPYLAFLYHDNKTIKFIFEMKMEWYELIL